MINLPQVESLECLPFHAASNPVPTHSVANMHEPRIAPLTHPPHLLIGISIMLRVGFPGKQSK